MFLDVFRDFDIPLENYIDKTWQNMTKNYKHPGDRRTGGILNHPCMMTLPKIHPCWRVYYGQSESIWANLSKMPFISTSTRGIPQDDTTSWTIVFVGFKSPTRLSLWAARMPAILNAYNNSIQDFLLNMRLSPRSHERKDGSSQLLFQLMATSRYHRLLVVHGIVCLWSWAFQVVRLVKWPLFDQDLWAPISLVRNFVKTCHAGGFPVHEARA